MQGESKHVLSLVPLGGMVPGGSRSAVQRDRAEDCHGTGIVGLCQPMKGRVSGPKGEHTVVLILSSSPPSFAPLLCLCPLSPQIPVLPTIGLSQRKYIGRNRRERRTSSNRYVCRSVFQREGLFCQAPPPTSVLDGDGSTTHPPSVPLPSPALPGSSRALPALLKGFELQTSAKTQAGRLYTTAVVSASWHPTSNPQIVLIIYLRVNARENCWGALRLQAESKSGRRKQLLAMAGAPASSRDGARGHACPTAPQGNRASLFQAAPCLSQEHFCTWACTSSPHKLSPGLLFGPKASAKAQVPAQAPFPGVKCLPWKPLVHLPAGGWTGWTSSRRC